MRSPKLPSLSAPGQGPTWYRYYAGYPVDFVDDILAQLAPKRGGSATVLDPWNGSGTTTMVASERGYTALGLDVNPALVVIARARSLGREVFDSLESITKDLEDKAADADCAELLDDDPLLRWFVPAAAKRLRGLERSVSKLLVDHDISVPLSHNAALEGVSSLASFFYVALFDVVRSALRPYVGSNPTWITEPADATERVTLSGIDSQFVAAAKRLHAYLDSRPVGLANGDSQTPTISVGSSRKLPSKDSTVDVVVASPPYCTRIDYVMATLPELAVLGFSPEQLRSLRDTMIGTPTMTGVELTADESWGSVTNDFLRTVAKHPSKASGGYYSKYFLQYFHAMWESLTELKRVTKSDGTVVLVVQDSYYKDIHIELASALTDMGTHLGWTSAERTNCEAPRTMAMVNPGARKYRSDIGAVESVLTLKG